MNMISSQNVRYPSSPYVVPEKLWFDSSGTNYPVWKAHLVYIYRPHGLLGYLDGSNQRPPETILNLNEYCKSMRNPDYEIWSRTDQSLKQRILSLIHEECVPATLVDDVQKTSRDIWEYLGSKFEHKFNQLAMGSGSGAGTITNAPVDRLLRDWNEYSQLYSAAQQGDWIAAGKIWDIPGKAESMKNSEQATALSIAIDAGEKAIIFVRILVEQMSKESIAVTDALGNTALNISAAVGNKEAARMLVEKDPNLLYIPNILGQFPVHAAAKHGYRDLLTYLISETKDDADNQNPYAGLSGLAILLWAIEADFYDIAISLVRKNPYLARLKHSTNSALKSITEKKFLFNVPKFSPGIKKMKKQQHLAVELVAYLCMEMKCLNLAEAEDIYSDAVFIAAEVGNHKVFKVIIEAFPNAMYCSRATSLETVAHVAVQNRSAKIFGLICKMSDRMHLNLDACDVEGNNLLHSVAKLASPQKLRGLLTAAVKMKHEFFWFKAVQNVLPPACREQLNNARKYPIEIFREQHSCLRMEAQQWITNTANTFMITATLVSAAASAAAITVPGGNDGNTGFPLFSKRSNFSSFIFSVSLSFVTSIISLLIFLYLSTTSYEEEDLLYYFPHMFHVGLASFVLSIVGLMGTFLAATDLAFEKRSKLISHLLTAAMFTIDAGLIRFQLLFVQKFLFSSPFPKSFTKKKKEED